MSGLVGVVTTYSFCLSQEFINNIVQLVRGFLFEGPNGPGGIEGFFNRIQEPTFIVKGCLHPVQILILDGVVVRGMMNC